MLRVGLRIKKYLKDNGIQQSFLCTRTNIPNNTLSYMLSGKRKIEVSEYFLICDALKVPYDYFANKNAG